MNENLWQGLARVLRQVLALLLALPAQEFLLGCMVLPPSVPLEHPRRVVPICLTLSEPAPAPKGFPLEPVIAKGVEPTQEVPLARPLLPDPPRQLEPPPLPFEPILSKPIATPLPAPKPRIRLPRTILPKAVLVPPKPILVAQATPEKATWSIAQRPQLAASQEFSSLAEKLAELRSQKPCGAGIGTSFRPSNAVSAGPAGVSGGTPQAASRTGSGKGRSDALSRYLERVRREIDRAKEYPQEARRQKIQGLLTVSFLISSEGKVLAPMVETSPSPILSDTIVCLLQNRSFPAPPQEWNPDCRIRLPVEFRLQ